MPLSAAFPVWNPLFAAPCRHGPDPNPSKVADVGCPMSSLAKPRSRSRSDLIPSPSRLSFSPRLRVSPRTSRCRGFLYTTTHLHPISAPASSSKSSLLYLLSPSDSFSTSCRASIGRSLGLLRCDRHRRRGDWHREKVCMKLGRELAL